MRDKLKYVCRERMPSGRYRYRFQRNGKKIAINGIPGSPAFYAHYAELMGEEVDQQVQGSINWLVQEYLTHVESMVESGQMAGSTLKQRRSQLKKVAELYGKKDMRMPRAAVYEIRDRLAATPGEANNTIKSLRAMFNFALKREWIDKNPCIGVEKLKMQGDGFEAWTVDDLRAYAKAHPEGTMAHLCLSLAMFTSARRGDLCRLGRQHEKTISGQKWLSWTQQKTGTLTEIPMMPQLERETRLIGGDMTYLLNAYGAAFTVAGLGNRFRAWANSAGIKKGLHGIRKAVPSLLVEVGVTPHQIMVLLGHNTTRQGETYTANADRRALALTLTDEMEKVQW